MIGWAAYKEIENDEYKKQQEQAQRTNALRGKRRQYRRNVFIFIASG